VSLHATSNEEAQEEEASVLAPAAMKFFHVGFFSVHCFFSCWGLRLRVGERSFTDDWFGFFFQPACAIASVGRVAERLGRIGFRLCAPWAISSL